MDEALHRLDQLRRRDALSAPIVCFDADSTCDPNYLIAIDSYFTSHPHSPGCSLYFEHPLAGPDPAEIYEAVTLYELHLRYYVQALRFARFPHAFHTIGSSMAVRASAYMQQGGMNKRQAGEDFYFLHKIIPLGQFGEVNTTRVLPSPRPSPRVPFGTGRAIRDYLATRKFETYPLQAFHDLKQLFARVDALRLNHSHQQRDPGHPDYQTDPRHRSAEPINSLAAPLRQFLHQIHFSEALAQIRAHTTTPETFRARFFRWFDGFQAMKYIHHARDTAYGPAEITASARALIASTHTSPRELLSAYRNLQRGN